MTTTAIITPADLVLAEINRESPMYALHEQHAAALAAQVPGWSGPPHHLFFHSVFAALPEVKSVLILGVYFGRDICIMSRCGKGRALQIVGVDKFSDTACEDWPDGKRNLSWEQAGFGKPPNAERALANITARKQANHDVRLIASDDAAFLPNITGNFDLIYIDTAHDRATVKRQIKQVQPLCHASTLIAGDDYESLGISTWGVKEAVAAGFTQHQVLCDVIWFANAADIK